MTSALPIVTPQPIAAESFTDAAAAVARLEALYERNTQFLRGRFEAYATGVAPTARVRAYYPFVRMTTGTHAKLDSRLAYGFVAGPGVHETSVTRPDLFRTYLTEQIGLLTMAWRSKSRSRPSRHSSILRPMRRSPALSYAHPSTRWRASRSLMR